MDEKKLSRTTMFSNCMCVFKPESRMWLWSLRLVKLLIKCGWTLEDSPPTTDHGPAVVGGTSPPTNTSMETTKIKDHSGRCCARAGHLQKLTSLAHLFDRREFLLTLHGERPQVRLHVLQQFLHRFWAAGRHL